MKQHVIAIFELFNLGFWFLPFCHVLRVHCMILTISSQAKGKRLVVNILYVYVYTFLFLGVIDWL